MIFSNKLKLLFLPTPLWINRFLFISFIALTTTLSLKEALNADTVEMTAHSVSDLENLGKTTDKITDPATHSKPLNYFDCITLGIVEGITEYLPISSTGHLLITNELLGLNSDQPLVREVDQSNAGTSDTYTLKEAAFAYVIIIQAGAILAVVFLYRSTLYNILLGLVGRHPRGRKLGFLILLSFLPAAVIGLALNDWIEQQLGDNLVAIALALFIGALAMLFTENKRARKRQQAKEKANRDRPMLEALDELSYAQALTIGFAQCLALWPGMSRSMVTIIGGYWVGLAPQKAAEYSFLLGLITLSAASAYKVFTDGAALSQTLALKPMLLGCAVAFFSAIYAIRFLVSCLNRYGLAPFAWYRIGLAVIILVLFLPKM